MKEDVDNSLVPLVHRGYLNIILNRKVNKHTILFMREIIWDESVYCDAAAAAAAAAAAGPRNDDTAAAAAAVCNQHDSP